MWQTSLQRFIILLSLCLLIACTPQADPTVAVDEGKTHSLVLGDIYDEAEEKIPGKQQRADYSEAQLS